MARIVEVTDSSNIRKIMYSVEESLLIVCFHDGGDYLFKDIPKDMFAEFVSADSVGEYFASNIRNVFHGVKV
jgi:hypothetical protein